MTAGYRITCMRHLRMPRGLPAGKGFWGSFSPSTLWLLYRPLSMLGWVFIWKPLFCPALMFTFSRESSSFRTWSAHSDDWAGMSSCVCFQVCCWTQKNSICHRQMPDKASQRVVQLLRSKLKQAAASCMWSSIQRMQQSKFDAYVSAIQAESCCWQDVV